MKLPFIVVLTVSLMADTLAFLAQSSLWTYRSLDEPRRLFSTQHFVDINENAPRDIATMQDWAFACGVQTAEGFQLVGENGDDGSLDVSVVSTQDIPATSPVLFVPSDMILSSNQAMQEFGRLCEDAEKVIIENKAEGQLRQYYLMLKILFEWERGDESPWFHWLNSLPRYYSNGASMTPFCYKCVPPLVASLAQQERVNLNHLSVKRVPFLSNDTKGRAELWKWAFQIVMTRSFEAKDGSGDLRIAPMMDMFNHGTDANVEYVYDEYGNCLVQTTQDVAAGSPLCMTYGDPTNPSFLFARYGFVDESSPASFCKIIPTHVNDEMRDLGYAHNRMLFFKTGDVSQEVWDILLYQILNENGSKQREFYQAHRNGDYETKQSIHELYYHETTAKLLEHIDRVLNQLDELSAKAYERDMDDHPRLPLILRHNEFVKNTFLAVRSRYFD